MSQSNISTFFKRKDGPNERSTLHHKKSRLSELTTLLPPIPTPLSERTRRWHLDDLSTTEPRSSEKETNHAKFVDKLGCTKETLRLELVPQPDAPCADRSGDGSSNEADVESDHEDAPDQSNLMQKFGHNVASLKNSSFTPKRSVNKSAKSSKFTPLEIQVQAIQKENPSTMLLVEVGYKYRFFGPDARKASEILGIACFKSRAFLTASIPTHRLYIHINRLVQAGIKVGVVRQMETAALKAVGDNKNKAFDRSLCEVYTKATYLGADEEGQSGGWIMALVEDVEVSRCDKTTAMENEALNDADGTAMSSTDGHQSQADNPYPAGCSTPCRTTLGLVAVRAESGEVLYDEFQDGSLRSELNKRMLLLEISELIIVGEITPATRQIISCSKIRVEELLPSKDPRARIEDFYHSRYAKSESALILSKILQLSQCILTCLVAQIEYLAEFNLQSIFTLTNFFEPMENKFSMHLPATSLAALEVFCNCADGTEYGSLFWLLNHTQTIPGKRLLRKWLARPLSVRSELQNRQGAVAEIVQATGTTCAQIDRARIMMKKLPDLEKSLSKIFYGSCSRPAVLQALQGLSRISRAFDRRETFVFQSEFLSEAFSSFSSVAEIVEGFLGEFNHVEAAKDDKYNMFKESDSLEALSDQKMGILIVESDLREHQKEIGKILKRKTIDYVTVAGVEYLVELKNDATKLVPTEWVKISGTRYVSRFHTPEIIKMVAEREQRKELLAIECDRAYTDFLKRIAGHYDTFRWIVSAVAEVDCLMSLARVSSDPSYSKPTILSSGGPTTINLKESRHPIIERVATDTYIPNDLYLQEDKMRAMILSGPNMGGKSSFIKQVALISIMAQIGCYVPCEHAELTILDGVYCRMGASDDMLSRESTFMVELHECSDIMAQSTNKSLVILDELGRGTSTFDGLAIASAALHHFLHEIRCPFLFVTHYPSLKQHAQDHPGLIGAWHMDYLEDQGSVTFLYKLVKGMADRSYGLNVAALAGLAPEIVERADEKAKEFEEDMKTRQMNLALQQFEEIVVRVDGGEGTGLLKDLEAIFRSVETNL